MEVKKDIKKSVKKESNLEHKNVISQKIKNIQELLKEYHVSEENATSKVLLDKMNEQLEYYIKILLQILQPEEFHSLHECTVFDDKEKNTIFETYKNMMILHREIVKSEIKNVESDMIATIEYVHSELIKYKPEMIALIHKMQDSWKHQASNGRVRYFG
ncbi:MAG: hypothetical protein ACP5NV_06865 [Candidatus Woesearchaeota archaeon]